MRLFFFPTHSLRKRFTHNKWHASLLSDISQYENGNFDDFFLPVNDDAMELAGPIIRQSRGLYQRLEGWKASYFGPQHLDDDKGQAQYICNRHMDKIWFHHAGFYQTSGRNCWIFCQISVVKFQSTVHISRRIFMEPVNISSFDFSVILSIQSRLTNRRNLSSTQQFKVWLWNIQNEVPREQGDFNIVILLQYQLSWQFLTPLTEHIIHPISRFSTWISCDIFSVKISFFRTSFTSRNGGIGSHGKCQIIISLCQIFRKLLCSSSHKQFWLK